MQRPELSADEPGGVWVHPSRATRRRRPVAVGEFEELFLLLTRLRAANAESLFALFFEPREIPERTTMRRLAWLVERGYLAHQRLVDSSRAVYFLTAKSIAAFPSVSARATDTMRRPSAPRQAAYCWLRATLHAALVRDGYTIGRGERERLALRRFLVDQQVERVARDKAGGRVDRSSDAVEALSELRAWELLKPLFRCRCTSCTWRGHLIARTRRCERCGERVEEIVVKRCFRCSRCTCTLASADEHRDAEGDSCRGRVVETDPLPFDVALRERAGVKELLVLFVDNPSRPLDVQIKELPLCVFGQPRVPIILRSPDPDSIYDARAGRWVAKGSRHHALLRAFDRDSKSSSISDRFTLIDFRPNLQLHVLR